MREHLAGPVFATLIDRKKASSGISGRDESNDIRRRLNGGFPCHFGRKSTVNMPGGRLKGGVFINYSKEQDLGNSRCEAGLEKMKDDAKVAFETEGNKRRGSDDDLLLQWGHRKRSRCIRLEPKHVTDGSSTLSKTMIRVDRRVVKADKQLISQTQVTVSSRGQSLRPCTLSVREASSGAVRRNGQDGNALLNGILTNNICSSSDVRHFPSHATEIDDQYFSASPEKHDTVSAGAHSMDSGSPDVCAMSNVQNAGEAGQDLPSASETVDLDSYEWPRILISLLRKEKEDDFLAIKGCKLPQRPKRRLKVVEKALHYCTPGNWLSDLTCGRYEVREKKSVKKKPRGLKAMESTESDSE